MAQGNLAQALKWYRDGLAVGLAGADRLAADPENAVWAAQPLAVLQQGWRRVDGARQSRRGPEIVPGRSGCFRPLGQVCPRKFRLAARRLHFIQKDRRCDRRRLSTDLAIFHHSVAKLEQASVSKPVSVKLWKSHSLGAKLLTVESSAHRTPQERSLCFRLGFIAFEERASPCLRSTPFELFISASF